MNTLETLKAARKKIQLPARWTQGAMARDGKGERVAPTSHEARCWCAQGALVACGYDFFPAYIELCHALGGSDEAVTNPVVLFNDAETRTHDEVLAAFDEAIARLSDACKQVTL